MRAGRFLILVVFFSLGTFAFAEGGENHSETANGYQRPPATPEEQVNRLTEKVNACMVGRGLSDSVAGSALKAGVSGGSSRSVSTY